MKCFRHRESDALGICKNCSKGLCSECAIDLKDGIACKDTCREKVERINAMISSAATKGRHLVLALVYCTMGIAFVFVGWGNSSQGPVAYVFSIPGAIFFAAGLYYLLAPKFASKN
ncbi:MAG: hypothetical protein C5B53_06095 [Candidatus Melainabacteria bacterium]|nr:MAG: hypothetical protein C5B53_06095 [Candidatus Melainabacteria bacterium]